MNDSHAAMQGDIYGHEIDCPSSAERFSPRPGRTASQPGENRINSSPFLGTTVYKSTDYGLRINGPTD
jgi:hypothetical protein